MAKKASRPNQPPQVPRSGPAGSKNSPQRTNSGVGNSRNTSSGRVSGGSLPPILTQPSTLIGIGLALAVLILGGIWLTSQQNQNPVTTTPQVPATFSPAANETAGAQSTTSPEAAGEGEGVAENELLSAAIPAPAGVLAGKPQWTTPFPMLLKPNLDYLARFKTGKGEFVVDLYEQEVPNTVNNFVVLAINGFYNDTTFHRVIEGFMAQGGDPTGTGTAGPGYDFEDEFSPNLKHDSEGILSMANSGPNTNGSQFFITFAPTPHLDGRHAVFGKVIEGMENVKSIALRDPDTSPTPGDTINTIEIFTK
jgi:cyclophilin family peptidyl-prolyl cis-trans isomerase